MKNMVGRVLGLFNPRPTMFDLCACLGVLGIPFIHQSIYGFYFCFYALFITVIGFSSKCVRNVNFPSLTIFSLLGLIGLFLHSFIYSPKSITFQYLNFYLMFEGFGYIFFGCVMFYVLVSKGKNLRLFFITLPISLIPFIKNTLYSGRGSILFALAIAVIFYLIKNKQYKWALVVFLFALDLLIWKYSWFTMKFRCRLPLWYDMIYSTDITNPGITLHPFIGSGFNKFLKPDNMMVSTSWGKTWLFIHNDYLNAIKILGVFFIAPLFLFINEIYDRVKNSIYLIPVLTILVLCFVQATMCFGDRAVVIVCILALSVIEKERI
jgi:hypothetical protein